MRDKRGDEDQSVIQEDTSKKKRKKAITFMALPQPKTGELYTSAARCALVAFQYRPWRG
jgi:hypothetical protein